MILYHVRVIFLSVPVLFLSVYLVCCIPPLRDRSRHGAMVYALIYTEDMLMSRRCAWSYGRTFRKRETLFVVESWLVSGEYDGDEGCVLSCGGLVLVHAFKC